MAPRGDATLIIRADVSATSVATVVVAVTAPDIPATLVFNIPVSNGVASGLITIPAGSNRAIALQAGQSADFPDDIAPVGFSARHKSAVVRFFPNGQLRAGRTPCLHHVFVASLAYGQPRQEVEDERVHCGVRHGGSS